MCQRFHKATRSCVKRRLDYFLRRNREPRRLVNNFSHLINSAPFCSLARFSNFASLSARKRSRIFGEDGDRYGSKKPCNRCYATISSSRHKSLARENSRNGVSRLPCESVNKNRRFIEVGRDPPPNNPRNLWRVLLQLRRCILKTVRLASFFFPPRPSRASRTVPMCLFNSESREYNRVPINFGPSAIDLTV